MPANSLQKLVCTDTDSIQRHVVTYWAYLLWHCTVDSNNSSLEVVCILSSLRTGRVNMHMSAFQAWV